MDNIDWLCKKKLIKTDYLINNLFYNPFFIFGIAFTIRFFYKIDIRSKASIIDYGFMTVVTSEEKVSIQVASGLNKVT